VEKKWQEAEAQVEVVGKALQEEAAWINSAAEEFEKAARQPSAVPT
jgi:hypothetical protein